MECALMRAQSAGPPCQTPSGFVPLCVMKNCPRCSSSRSRHGSLRGVDGLPKQLWQASPIGAADARAVWRDDRARVTNQVRASACPTSIPKSLALLTPRLIEEGTSRGDAVLPAQTTPMRAIAAKRERGSGAFSRGGRNASRWFTLLSVVSIRLAQHKRPGEASGPPAQVPC
jgi:hypothetical protein